MFEMTIKSVLHVRNVFAVAGECIGRNELKPGILKDETGREYKYFIPIGKRYDFDDNKIDIQLLEESLNINDLVGMKLIQ